MTDPCSCVALARGYYGRPPRAEFPRLPGERMQEPPGKQPVEFHRARIVAEACADCVCPFCGAVCDSVDELGYHKRACSAKPDRKPRGTGRTAMRLRRSIETQGEYAERMRLIERSAK